MPSALAIVAHPDDIEFLMAGTLILLKQRGWETHYFNVTDGCCGSMVTGREETARTRTREARDAALSMGAQFHEPVCHDMSVYYTPELLARVARVVRTANPDLVLTHAPSDYMEDHQNACRLAVSATFTKNMPNFQADNGTPPGSGEVAVYHGQPHSNHDPLGQRVYPTHLVNIQSVVDEKEAALACHKSQTDWLDSTQGMESLASTMQTFGRDVANQSDGIELGEGFRRHNPTGFGPLDFDPLAAALADVIEVQKTDFMR
jgi:LmbE family N-acetylglucosaminyl deacetylase